MLCCLVGSDNFYKEIVENYIYKVENYIYKKDIFTCWDVKKSNCPFTLVGYED